MTENNEITVKEMFEKLMKQNEELLEKGEAKRMKIPWKARVGKGAVAKGWATYIYIRENGELDFIKQKIEDETAKIDGMPRVSTIDYKLTYKGMPVYIIPSWSLKPFSPVENYGETEKENMNIAGRRIVLAKLEKEAIKGKGGLGGGFIMWVLIILGVGVAAWYLLKGGKLF